MTSFSLRFIYAILLFTALTTCMTLGAMRYLFTNIDHHKEWLLELAADYTKSPIPARLGQVEATWNVLNSSLSIQNLQIAEIAQVDAMRLGIDWRPLLALRPPQFQIQASGVSINLRLDKHDGSEQTLDNASYSEQLNTLIEAFNALPLWKFMQFVRRVEVNDLRFLLKTENEHALREREITISTARLSYNPAYRTMRVFMESMQQSAAPMSVLAQIQRVQGKVMISTQARIENFSPRTWLPQDRFLELESWLPEHINASLSIDFNKDGKLFVWLSDVSLNYPESSNQLPPLAATLAQDRLTVNLPSADIATLSNFVLGQPVPEVFRKILSRITPRGQLNRIELDVPLKKWRRARLKAEVENLSIMAWDDIPGISNLNGYVEANPTNGFIEIANNPDLSLSFPKLWPYKLSEFKQIGGILNWRIQDQVFSIGGVPIVLKEFDGSYATIRFDVDIDPRPESKSTKFSLLLGMNNFNQHNLGKYIPQILDPDLKQWIQDAFTKFEAPHGGLIYRTTIENGQEYGASLQLYAKVLNGVVNYADDWPPAKQFFGTVTVNDNIARAKAQLLSIDGDSWQIYGPATLLARSTSSKLVARGKQALVIDLENINLTAPIFTSPSTGLRLTLENSGERWTAHARNQDIDAIAIVSDDPIVRLRIKRLRTDWPQDDSQTADDIDPSTWPAIDARIETLFIDGALGRHQINDLQVKMRNTGRRVLAQANAKMNSLAIKGLGNKKLPVLSWDYVIGESRFQGSFSTEKIDQELLYWDYPKLLRADSAELDIDVHWPKSPFHFDLSHLNGALYFRAANGEVYEVGDNSDALRIVRSLNIDSWLPKILKGESTGVLDKGVRYSSINFPGKFFHGILSTDKNAVLKSDSGRLAFSGDIDFHDDLINGTLSITLPTSNNLPWLGAIIAGLPFGIGAYLVTEAFKDEINQLTNLDYKVFGRWDDPSIKAK